MTELQIFKVLTDLDDALVLQADTEPRPRRTARLISRLPLVAAIIGLLAVTAFAVNMTLSVHYVDHTFERPGLTLSSKLGYGYLFEEGDYAAEVAYFLEPVSPKNSELLTDALTDAWERWDAGHEHFTGSYLLDETGARFRFDGLASVAETFSLPLTTSTALDAADGPCYLRLLIADPTKSALEYADSGKVQPAALVIEDALSVDGSESGLTVYVALGQSLPPSFSLRELQFLHLEGEPKESRFQTDDGVELTIVQTGADGEEYNSCAVVWCENGIGYLAFLRGRWDGGQAQDVLMPLLADIKRQ